MFQWLCGGLEHRNSTNLSTCMHYDVVANIKPLGDDNEEK